MLPVSNGDKGFNAKDGVGLFEGALSPAQLVWLISERYPIENVSSFKDSMSDLTELGSKLGVDNLCRGFGGLDRILLRPQYIKLAGELTRDIQTNVAKQRLLSTFCTMARKMKAPLIVAGIERMEELQVVRSLGVRFVEGYLLARPSRAFQTLPSVEI